MDGDLELQLKKINDDGARLAIGFYDDIFFNPPLWDEKVSIYAGLVPTKFWAYGRESEQHHDVHFEFKDLYLSRRYRKTIFEFMKRFYEKFKDIALDAQRVFDGRYTEHSPRL